MNFHKITPNPNAEWQTATDGHYLKVTHYELQFSKEMTLQLIPDNGQDFLVRCINTAEKDKITSSVSGFHLEFIIPAEDTIQLTQDKAMSKTHEQLQCFANMLHRIDEVLYTTEKQKKGNK